MTQKLETRHQGVAVNHTRKSRVYAKLMGAPRPVRYAAALLLSIMALFSGMVSSYADGTTDTTGTSGLFSGVSSALTSTLIPAVVGIVLIGSLFWLGLRWYQKGKNAGNK